MKRSSLNSMSPKRKEEMKEYSKLRKVYMKDHHECEICLALYAPVVNLATEIHHRLPLGRGGKLTDTSIFIAICRPCHELMKSQIKWAEEKTYVLRHRNELQDMKPLKNKGTR